MRSRYWMFVLILVTFALIVSGCADTTDTDEQMADDDAPTEAVPTPSPTMEPSPTQPPEAVGDDTETDTPSEPDGEMTIYHFDVGQADATLIDAPDVNILIDAGDWQREDVLPYLESAGIESLDLLVLTHPDADHIGQVPQVMESFDVAEVWTNGWEHDTQTFERSLDAILDSDAAYHEPSAGETVTFGNVIVEVVNPDGAAEDSNDSLAVRLEYGEFTALYTGDAEAEHESDMLSGDHDLTAEVLQLGHHGSETSTTAEFLDAVSPSVAIYTAGEDNEYGHPHEEVVSRVQGAGIELYGTDVHGTIIVTTDGESYDVSTERDGTIEAPEPTPEPEPTAEPEPASGGLEFVEVNGGPPGSDASVTVQTEPAAECSIGYTTPSGTDSQAQGLEDKSANESGNVSWTWSIGPSTNPGEGTVRVTCGGETAAASIVIDG